MTVNKMDVSRQRHHRTHQDNRPLHPSMAGIQQPSFTTLLNPSTDEPDNQPNTSHVNPVRHRLLPPPPASHKQHTTDDSHHSELADALQASSRQLELEDALAAQEEDELARALSLSAASPSELGAASSTDFLSSSCSPSTLPTGTAYPVEQECRTEDAMLALAIQLSIEERDHWNGRGAHGRDEELIAQLAPPPPPTSCRRRRVPPRPLPAIKTSNRPPPLPPRSAQTPTQISFDAITPTANHSLATSLSTGASPDASTYTGIISLPHSPPLTSSTSCSPPGANVLCFPPSPATSSSEVGSESDDGECCSSFHDHYHPLGSIAPSLRDGDTSPSSSYPTEHATSYFPPSSAVALRTSSSGLVNPHILTPHPCFTPAQESAKPNKGAPVSDDSFVTAPETLERNLELKKDDDDHRAECGTESFIMSAGSRELSAEKLTWPFPSAEHHQDIRDDRLPHDRDPTASGSSSSGLPAQPLSSRYSAVTSTAQHFEDRSTIESETLANVREPPADAHGLAILHQLEHVEAPPDNPDSAEPESDPLPDLTARYGFVEADGEIKNEHEEEEGMDETVSLFKHPDGRQEFAIESQSWADLLHWLMWWGDTRVESGDAGKSGRGVVRLVLEFKGSLTQGVNPNEVGFVSGSVRLSIKLISPGVQQQVEEADMPARGKRPSSECPRRHSIPDPVLLPCRFSGLAVTLFTLGQLAGIACSTAAGHDATNAYRALRGLGQSIALLDQHGAPARDRTGGLVVRLRDRLRRLRRPEEDRARKRGPRTRGTPLKRVERSEADMIGAEDGLRWLPVL